MKRDATDTKDDIQSLARAHSADAIAVLAEIMNNTDAPAGARLSAAKALLDRGWGKAGAKPPDDGNRATPVSQIKRVIVDPRHDDATRPSPSANVPMTNRAAAGLSRVRSGLRSKRNGPVDHFERRTSGLPKANEMVQWSEARSRKRQIGPVDRFEGRTPERQRWAERRTVDSDSVSTAWASGWSDFAGNPVTGAIFPANSSSFASTKPAILPSSRFRIFGGYR